jgi:hypothetical protein
VQLLWGSHQILNIIFILVMGFNAILRIINPIWWVMTDNNGFKEIEL